MNINKMSCPRIVIAGTESGVGKTSLTLALVAALKRRGLRVQTFKVGPDFLDPTYLALASGKPCYNLDGWMMGQDYCRRLFARASQGADIAVIEGVMGLFDGADTSTSSGSTAEIARWLQAPVALIVNVHGMARSLAAVVKGFTEFEKDLNVAAVIANRCGSELHEAWLSDALKAAALPPLAGGVPRGGLPHLPSRHLGLVTADDGNLTPEVLAALADAFDQHISVDKILALAQGAPALDITAPEGTLPQKQISLGVAWDEAFHFYYQDLFDELALRGCTVQRFSPLRDSRLPTGLDALYFGGGYPELHSEALSANVNMLADIRAFAASGRPVYAECGGLMYLCELLETKEGKSYPMAGLVPGAVQMLDRLKTLGYVEVTLKNKSLWGPPGAVLRGHEFHYSQLIGDPVGRDGWNNAYYLKKCRSEVSSPDGFQRGRVLASYVHLHLASRPEAVDHFVNQCRARHD